LRAATTPQARTHLLRQVSAVVCVSDWVRQRLTEGVVDAALTAKVSVIHNGLDLDAAPPPRAKRDPLILFVGRITADKGFDSFVRACGIALPLLPGWRAEAAPMMASICGRVMRNNSWRVEGGGGGRGGRNIEES
jgi:glycosyltransferase involved in cell wall biosynthesis